MEQLNNVDVIFLIIAGISALVGIARGMTKEILSIIGWVLAVAALFYLVPLVTPFMENYVTSKRLASILTGMAVLLIFCIIWILTVDKLASMIRSSKLSALDRMFGFVFGLARGALLVILIALLISTLMPTDSKKGVFEKSVLFKQANACVEPLVEMIPQSWVNAFKAQTERFGFGKKAEEKVEDAAETTDTKTPETEDKAKDKTEDKAKDTSKENEKPAEIKTDESAEPEAEKSGLEKTLDAINNNREVLKKGSEILFNQLAQPKTSEGGSDENSINLDDLASDLDKLLDVLDDRVVTTDEATPADTAKPKK